MRGLVTVVILGTIVGAVKRRIFLTLNRICPGKKKCAIGGTHNKNLATMNNELAIMAFVGLYVAFLFVVFNSQSQWQGKMATISLI